MKVTNHAKLSLILSIPTAYLTGPVAATAGCIIGGVLIDADHVMDYSLNYRIPFNREGFFSGTMVKSLLFNSPLTVGRKLRLIKRNPDGPARSYLLFHSLELWIAVFAFIENPFFLALAIGGIGHLVSDYMTWKRPWYAFSFFYRFFIGFDLDEIQKYTDMLKASGVDINLCKDCGIRGKHELHYEPIGKNHRKRSAANFMILCFECHDKRHNAYTGR